MEIGLLYEGKYDKQSLQEIISLILVELLPLNSFPIDFIEYEASGQITTKIEAACIKFFETLPVCKLAIFISDTDKYLTRCSEINDRVQTYLQQYPDRIIVVGCITPHFEQWFLDEEQAVKKVLKIPATESIRDASLMPKDILAKLIREYNKDTSRSGDEIYTKTDIYIDIAKNINIKLLLQRNGQFKSFYNSLKECVTNLA